MRIIDLHCFEFTDDGIVYEGDIFPSKTFSGKMNGKVDWTLTEIQYLQSVLENLDVCKVFCFQNKMER